MPKFWLRLLILMLMIALLTVLVPSGAMLPDASAAATGESIMPDPIDIPPLLPVTLAPLSEPLPKEGAAPYLPKKEAYLKDHAGYVDSTISVQIKTIRAYRSVIQLAYIQIADPSQMRVHLARPYPSKYTVRADVLAKRVNAVFAINGDYFTYHGNGVIYRDGKLLRNQPNEQYDTLIIDEKGDLFIISPTTKENIEAYQGTIVQCFSFGPGLVINGKKQESFKQKYSIPNSMAQRMGIAQLGPLSYLVIATEGPENKGSTGLTMDEFAQLMYDLGAINAYNLDGGSSSSMVLDNRKINALSTNKVRPISDIIYFATGEAP